MNTNISKKTLTVALFFIGVFSSRTAFAEGFVRPSALYLDYTESELPSKGGAGVAAGVALGAEKKHELSLEIMRSPWSWSSPWGSFPGLGTTGSGHIMPTVVNYRYYFGNADSRFRFYAGGSAGVVKVTGDVTVSLSGVQYGASIDKTEVAFAGTVGISGTLVSIISYDLGYRFLQADGFDVTSYTYPVFRPTIKFPKTSAHILAAGLTIKF